MSAAASTIAEQADASLDPTRSFQGLILTLQNFWARQGCVILQPYDMEVGAGTFHPATTLRSLGPTPWKAAYAQPSRRPKDGRYGENPNRLQHYYQFQVILKPSPENLQALYLDSLKAIGVDEGPAELHAVWALSCVRASPMTCAPLAAREFIVSKPIPELQPVTTYRLPVRSIPARTWSAVERPLNGFE